MILVYIYSVYTEIYRIAVYFVGENFADLLLCTKILLMNIVLRKFTHKIYPPYDIHVYATAYVYVRYRNPKLYTTMYRHV